MWRWLRQFRAVEPLFLMLLLFSLVGVRFAVFRLSASGAGSLSAWTGLTCVSLNVVCVNAWMYVCGHVFFCLGMHRVVCIRCWPKVMAADGRDPTPTWWACWEQSVPRLGGLSVVVRERWTSHRSLFSLAHVSMHAITHSSSGKAQPSAVSCVHGKFSFLTRCGSSVHS